MKVFITISTICSALFFLPTNISAVQDNRAHIEIRPAELAETNLSDIFRDSFELFQLLRNDKGIYRDAARFDGAHFHPSSVAVIGMGLISLCIAKEMNWISNSEEVAKTTLRSITGNNPSFNPDRNQSGFYRHWIEMETGERAWNSEYSSIDTAILVSGALFCKKYFNSSQIDTYADDLTRP